MLLDTQIHQYGFTTSVFKDVSISGWFVLLTLKITAFCSLHCKLFESNLLLLLIARK